MRVSIMIPVYQEEATVGRLLDKVAAVDVSAAGFERELLVCDDGSTDATPACLRDAAARIPGLRVFTHAVNQGKGAAIRTMLAHATGDVVLVQDADLEYDTADIVPLLRSFAQGRDAVYGSRFLATRWPHGMRTAHWLANRLLTLTANLLYGHRLTDEATCLKLVRTDLLRAMQLECLGFEFCPEVTAKLGRQGVTIDEVPVRYEGRDAARGKKVRWQDGVTAMAVLFRHRWP
jgi:dolichol-phosphate mannosyltransferase